MGVCVSQKAQASKGTSSPSGHPELRARAYPSLPFLWNHIGNQRSAVIENSDHSGRTGIVSRGGSNLLSTGGSFFANAEGVEELEEKEMEKNMGKAFYFILKLKNYRKIL